MATRTSPTMRTPAIGGGAIDRCAVATVDASAPVTSTLHAAMLVAATLIAAMLIAAPLAAQTGTKPSAPKAPAKASSAASATAQPVLVGQWSGTATVPLPDSTIVVPVFYTFTESATGIGGTAMVPGQGSGPISRVVRDGSRLQFRVEVKEGALDHDVKFGADGSIEGMVNLNNQPVAKIRISPKKPAKP